MAPPEKDPRLSKWTKSLEHFIEAHTVDKGCEYTHTSLNAPPSSFYVPADHLDKFYELYVKAIEDGQDLYITEKNRHIGPLVVDLDFRFATAPAAPLKHQYTNETLDAIVAAYGQVVNKYLQVGQGAGAGAAYVMEKSAPVECKGVLKDGIHIVFPGVVTKASVKYLIRQEVMALLEGVFRAIGATNPIGDIVDESIIERNNWFMYGSKKKGGEPYVVTRIYDINGPGPKALPMPLPLPPAETWTRMFSIRNKNSETRIKSEQVDAVLQFEEKEQEAKRNMNVTRKIVGSEVNRSQRYCEDLDKVEKLIDLLSVDRCKSYESWIRLGWCLRNIDNRLVAKWDEFSARCPAKYKRGECERMWDRMRESGLGVGSLHLWARSDNPEGYKELMKDDLRTLLYTSTSMTHYDIAKVVHHLFQHDFVCASYKNRYWYEFRNHRWNISDSGLGLRARLSEDVWRVYKLEAMEYSQKAIASNDANNQNRYEDISKKMSEISYKLRNTSFKENIMKECSELFYADKFEERLDSNTHLVGFNNGVYDLETHTFRDGRPDDYVSFSTGNNYIPYEPDNPIQLAIAEYLEQVLTKKEVREYVLKLYATMISGQIKEQKFYIWTGTGSNSKSLLVDLFEKSYGEYCCKFPVTLLTGKRCASNAANSEVARAKGKRFACLQEPGGDEQINIGLMKELSGGDKIMARALYKEPFEFVPQFKMLLLCNALPNVPSDDGGTWRRIRVVEFKSKFVENPDPDNPNEFQIDYDLAEKMEDWREHFMALLIHYYKKYQDEGITEPAEVMQCTTEYKSQNDHMAYYVKKYFERKDSGFLCLDEAHVELRNYIKEDGIPIKLMSKQELERYLVKVMGTCVSHSGSRGFKGWRMRPLLELKPEEEEEEEEEEE